MRRDHRTDRCLGAILWMFLVLAGWVLGSAATTAQAQAPSPLDGFVPNADDTVWALAVQQDGRVVAGGDFSSIGGGSANRIARLNPDGSLDSTFDTSTGADATVYAVAAGPGGTVFLGGDFATVDATTRTRTGIARLNSDGSLDASFDPGTGANDSVLALAVQTDGKVLLGGWFTQIDGTACNRIARLNADGSLDATFDAGAGADATVWAVAVQTDGKILVGGDFTGIDGVACPNIARLNADGSLDTTFDPGTGPDASVRALAVQVDGRVLVAGQFSHVDGTTRSCVARFDTGGALDLSFDPGTGADDSVFALVLQPDGKVLIGGDFANLDSAACGRIARLHPDGTLDDAFDPGVGADSSVYALAVQPDGCAVLGGAFSYFSGTPRSCIARVGIGGRSTSPSAPSWGLATRCSPWRCRPTARS